MIEQSPYKDVYNGFHKCRAQLLTKISCDEKDDIDFMSQFEIELGRQEASNVDLDVIEETLLPKLVAN